MGKGSSMSTWICIKYHHGITCTRLSVVVNRAKPRVIELLTLIIQREKPLARPRVSRRGTWGQLPREEAGPRWPMERSLRSPYSKEAHNTLSLCSSFLGPDTAYMRQKRNLILYSQWSYMCTLYIIHVYYVHTGKSLGQSLRAVL